MRRRKDESTDFPEDIEEEEAESSASLLSVAGVHEANKALGISTEALPFLIIIPSIGRDVTKL